MRNGIPKGWVLSPNQSGLNPPAVSNNELPKGWSLSPNQSGLNSAPKKKSQPVSQPSNNSGIFSLTGPIAQTAWQAAKDAIPAVGAGAIDLGKDVGVPALNAASKIAPELGKYAQKLQNVNPNKTVGLPDNPTWNAITSGLAGLGGSFVGGPELAGGKLGASLLGRGANLLTGHILPQAGMGALMDPGNREQGAMVGGIGASLAPIFGGIKNAFGSGEGVINNIKSIFESKNMALESAKQAASDKFVSNIISKRLKNTGEYSSRYPVLQQAADHPIPGITNNYTADIKSLFGETPATDFYEKNMGHFLNNYPEMQEGIDQTDNLISPNFSKKVGKYVTPDTDFGTPSDPVKPMQAYQDLIINPTVENAARAKKFFNYAKNSKMAQSMPGVSAAFNTAANQIDKNMIIPALKDFDEKNGTSLAKTYISAAPFYKQEKEWEEISPQFDSLSSGNWLPGSTDYKSVSNVMKNAAKNNSISSGSYLHDAASKLQQTISKNTQKQAQNNQDLVSKIIKIRNRGGPRAQFGNLAGGLGNISQYTQPLALGALQYANQTQK